MHLSSEVNVTVDCRGPALCKGDKIKTCYINLFTYSKTKRLMLWA